MFCGSLMVSVPTGGSGEEVHQEAAPQCTEQCRPQPADQCDGNRAGELESATAVATLWYGFTASKQLQQHRKDDCHSEADDDPDASKVPLPWMVDAAPAKRVGDHVHVDIAGVPTTRLPIPPAPNSLAMRFLWREIADDDLGGVDAAGEVQQGLGRVLSGHGVVAAAKVPDQLALGFECLR